MNHALLFLFFLVINCSSSDVETLQETEKRVIDELRAEIKELAASSICSRTYSCYSAGLGSKPCGGNWEYIVYSSSIDTTSLLSMIKDLNKKESSYNEKYDIASDCALVMPPSWINCEDGKCQAIYR